MRIRGIALRVMLALACCAVPAAVAAGPASAAGGWWSIRGSIAPTKPQPGKPAILQAIVSNAGYKTITGTEANPIVLRVTLPQGFEESVEAGHEGPSAIAGPVVAAGALNRFPKKLKCTVTTGLLTCPYAGVLPPSETVRLTWTGQMAASTPPGARELGVEMSGGDAERPASFTQHFEVRAAEETEFGVSRYEIIPENAKGEPEPQAGAHPFQLTSIFEPNLNTEFAKPFGAVNLYPYPVTLPKDLHFTLPAGLIGKATGIPQCSGADFANKLPGNSNLCEEKSAIGYASVSIFNPIAQGQGWGTVPVFNLKPEPGEPARFGFEYFGVPVVLTTHVRSGKDYAVEVTVHEAPESAAILTTQLTLWGVPHDPRHDSERGWQCLQEGSWLSTFSKCKTGVQVEAEENKELEAEGKAPHGEPEAFLSMPTSCESTPETSASGEAWNTAKYGFPGEAPIVSRFFEGKEFPDGHHFEGCEKLAFEPSISVKPDKTEAATPSGYTVTVSVNQSGTVSGKQAGPNPGEEPARADAAVKATTLYLPPGVFASAGASQGLETCTSKGFGFEGPEPLGPLGPEAEIKELLENNKFSQAALNKIECPESAKMGTVDIETPFLEEHVLGNVYLSREDTSPFKSPLVLYIFGETPASHVQVKLAGIVEPQPNGQLKSVFANTPPVQFSKLTLHLRDDPRSSQSTPEKCGSYESVGMFEASSKPGATTPATSSFSINEGAGGGPCNPAFAPSTEAGAKSEQAGAFSPFRVVIRKPDGENQLRSISVTEPPGAAAMLANVTPCPTATAEQIAPETVSLASRYTGASCPASSIVGKSTAIAGLGTATYGAAAARVTLPGTVYLTGPYHGAPFGLLDVTETEGHTGPFHLGNIGVMSRILVDENTAQATVVSNPLPQFVEGVPASISEIEVNVDRPGFTFNPTNCSPLSVTGSLTGWNPNGTPEGTFAINQPFHVNNCASLPFKPELSVELEPNVSRVEGTGLVVKLKAAKGESNIHKTKLVFPTSIPSRLTTIQKACDDHIFNANPANCPEGSVIGTAIARTPVLKSPLVGPAYLVSHANASFPDAEFVLQGEGIKLLLDGKTDIKKGITSSSFESVPDAPVETFEVKLPRGPHSAFSGFGDLCATPQQLPTEFVGQNGVTINLTTTAKLVNSINTGTSAVCSSTTVKKAPTELQKLLAKCKKLKSKSKRAKCEATARKQVKAVATCKKKNKGHSSKMNSCIAKARKTYALKLK
jgi:hypothetical protein